ncbi:hypothetical protein EV122DRAFT_285241 [Schizophyllum commune]
MSSSGSPATQVDSTNDAASAADPASLARLQRQLHLARRDYAQLQGLKRGRIDPLTSLARGLRRLVTLEDDVSKLQEEADRRDEADAAADGEEQQVLSVDEQRDADRRYNSYGALIKLVPDLQSALIGPANELEAMFKKIQHAGNTARGEDIMMIRGFVATKLNAAPYNSQPPLNPQDRVDRGLKNPVTARLICPADFDVDDPAVLAKVSNGDPDFMLGDSFFLNCLYLRGKGDPNDVTTGFLRSGLLVETYRAVFISRRPSSDDDSDEEDAAEAPPPAKKRKLMDGAQNKPSTRANVASLLRMNGQVTPRSIAYIAVLLHFNLTDAVQWRREYYGINYGALYDFIVDYFEDYDETTDVGKLAKENARDLLAWWNKKIFPARAYAKANSQASRTKLAAQLAAKAAAASAAS